MSWVWTRLIQHAITPSSSFETIGCHISRTGGFTRAIGVRRHQKWDRHSLPQPRKRNMGSTSHAMEKPVLVHDNTSIFSPNAIVDSPVALLVLNNPSGLQTDYITTLWNKAFFKVSADGASNWIYDNFHGKFVPDLLHGDLDSIRPEVAEYFESKGASVITDKCQDTSDIEKCLSKIKALPNSSKITVVIAGVFGGRFDHEMGNLNVAYRSIGAFQRLILISTETLGEVLTANTKHRILPDRAREGPTCGMIPLFGPSSRVDTEGLRWNMEGRGSSFGALVSTSNEIAAKEVEILADAPLLWTTTFRHASNATGTDKL